MVFDGVYSAMEEKEISPSFSVFILGHLRGNNDQSIEVQDIAAVLELDTESFKQIETGERGFTVEQLTKLEKANGISISSLLLDELEKTDIPTDLQDIYDKFLKFSEGSGRLQKSLTEEVVNYATALEKHLRLQTEIRELEIKARRAKKVRTERSELDKTTL